tara:strand:- start:2601 stop:2729 length:129 start_codon:yes stop_codon:yes gene_type:complete
MIYKNIEKLVLNTSDNEELGKTIRELYWTEVLHTTFEADLEN